MLLHRLRLARSRARAQTWIGKGHIRVNGERVSANDRRIAAGDIVTLPMAGPPGPSVLVIEIGALPARRGPADEAQRHYRALDVRGSSTLACAPPASQVSRHAPPPAGTRATRE